MSHPARFLFLVVFALPGMAFGVVAISALILRSMRLPVCPSCLRREVRPAHRHGNVDEGLAALRLFPFRCHACLKRFHAFDPGRAREHNSELKRRRIARA
ncbi:MAG TPA: hypothetical protein VMB85_22885 [Bryobacteraceae bacterium]|nr:hypothetical protein [Bryobacteraceae bacterium]